MNKGMCKNILCLPAASYYEAGVGGLNSGTVKWPPMFIKKKTILGFYAGKNKRTKPNNSLYLLFLPA